MKTIIRHNDVTWVDLENPSKKELDDLRDEFDIHSLILRELENPTTRSKVDEYKNYLFAILHFPEDNDSLGSTSGEVDFVVGEKFLITTHYKKNVSLSSFGGVLGAEGLPTDETPINNGAMIFFYLLKHMYGSLEKGIEKINEQLDNIEEKIFQGSHKEMVAQIADTGHSIFDLRRALKHHRPVLESLESTATRIFGAEFSRFSVALLGEYAKIWNAVDDARELLADLERTNDSLLANRTNEIMKTLTIMAFITFPLTLVATIFGMNTENTPIVGANGDFWIVLGFMIIGMLGMVAWFKHKKWI